MLGQGECGGYFNVKLTSYAMIMYYDHAPVLSISQSKPNFFKDIKVIKQNSNI